MAPWWPPWLWSRPQWYRRRFFQPLSRVTSEAPCCMLPKGLLESLKKATWWKLPIWVDTWVVSQNHLKQTRCFVPAWFLPKVSIAALLAARRHHNGSEQNFCWRKLSIGSCVRSSFGKRGRKEDELVPDSEKHKGKLFDSGRCLKMSKILRIYNNLQGNCHHTWPFDNDILQFMLESL